MGRCIAIPPCGYCQLFVGSLTRQHRAMPPAAPPRPQPSAPLSTKLDTAQVHPLSEGKCAHCHVPSTCACVHLPSESGGIEQCQASWTMGPRAEDGGVRRVAWCDAGESGFPRRAGNTRKEGSLCNVPHSPHSRLKQVRGVCGHGLVGLQRL